MRSISNFTKVSLEDRHCPEKKDGYSYNQLFVRVQSGRQPMKGLERGRVPKG